MVFFTLLQVKNLAFLVVLLLELKCVLKPVVLLSQKLIGDLKMVKRLGDLLRFSLLPILYSLLNNTSNVPPVCFNRRRALWLVLVIFFWCS
jgi:hypothetical protein